MEVKWLETNLVGKILRLSQVFYSKKIPIIPTLLHHLNRVIFSCDIHYTSDIHPSVMFGHNGLGTVVHLEATIGQNTLVMHHVTIGSNKAKGRLDQGKRVTYPVIGENVFIGPGAMILGPFIIGDNAQIGAGSIVLNDVPKNGVVVGNPARLIRTLTDEEVTSAKPD